MNPFKSMSGSKRALMGLGSALFVAGVVVLCFALFSGDSSSGAPPRGDTELRDVQHIPTYTKLPATPGAAPVTTPVSAPPLAGQDYQMFIDKIGVVAPVDTYGLDENLTPVVPTGDDARDVVAWYDFSAEPGTGSNVVFGGHVTWFGPAVFWDLGSLVAGDEIRLVGVDGTQVLYKITDVYRVASDDAQAVEVMWPTPDPVITVITCVGDFVDTNDPVFGGEYPERLVVRGALSSITPGAAVAAEGVATGG